MSVKRRYRRRGVAFMEFAMVLFFIGFPVLWGLFEFGVDTTDTQSLDRAVHSASQVGITGLDYNVIIPDNQNSASGILSSVANAEHDAFTNVSGLAESQYHMRIIFAYYPNEISPPQVFVYDFGDGQFLPDWTWDGTVLQGPENQSYPMRPGDRVVSTEVYAQYPALIQSFTSTRSKRAWELAPG